jgi:hypothetical protein
MEGYIVCEKKGNFPRIHVKICQRRCPHTDTCKAYQDFMKTTLHEDIAVPSNSPASFPENTLAAPSL